MLVDFFGHLRHAGVPVSLREFLDLLAALEARVVSCNVDDFYGLARACLVKDERLYDRFDLAFGSYFEGLELAGEALLEADIPESWLREQLQRHFSDEERAKLEQLGFDELLQKFRERLAEQDSAHHGGGKWIGTGGTSPFGHGGWNPAGIRVGGGPNYKGARRAVKVWDKREFRNLDDGVELGTRNIKVALRKLRRFARDGAPTELDLDGTIRATARQGGLLDLKLVPERHNLVKVLAFFDVGGSMDDHVRVCEELFSAVRSEFKHLEYYYFHNCVYESVWRDNRRRHAERIPTWEVLHTYGADYKLIFVGDATMSPYEIVHAGGSVEHWNEEPGVAWMRRLLETFPKAAWLNPQPEAHWDSIYSLQMVRELMQQRMYPLTLEGLGNAVRELGR
ncbi:MAG TPA: VWA domain-containing protein [Gammaproteobacteria bacterium]